MTTLIQLTAVGVSIIIGGWAVRHRKQIKDDYYSWDDRVKTVVVCGVSLILAGAAMHLIR